MLSTTTKAKARKERKEGKAPGESEKGSPSKIPDKDEEMANEEAKKEEEKKNEPEPDF